MTANIKGHSKYVLKDSEKTKQTKKMLIKELVLMKKYSGPFYTRTLFFYKIFLTFTRAMINKNYNETLDVNLPC